MVTEVGYLKPVSLRAEKSRPRARGTRRFEMVETRATAGRYRKKGEYVARVIAGETIVVPIRGQVGDLESIYSVNEVGSVIWEMIDGETPVSRMVEAVCRRFEVAPELAEIDALDFLKGLEAAGLVEAC